MEPYTYPQGPVISYGWGIENRVGVGILEGSEVNNSTLDNIHEVFEGIVEKAVDDIEKAEEPSGAEETNKTEGSTEDTRKPVNVSGLGAIFTLLVILISAFILKRR